MPRNRQPLPLGARIFWAVVLAWGTLTLLALVTLAQAAEIPREALAHRSTLVRAARAEWGLGAPVAVMAAQVHQESRWRADAVSPVGAQGLAQFMPATARWLPEVAPQTGTPEPWNPGWALRALAAYDLWLWRRVEAADDCNRWALTLSAYNGGLGWVRRDAALARAHGLDPLRWWGQVEAVNAGRGPAAWRENRTYPRRIMLHLTPLYAAAGWGQGVCP